MIQTRDRFWIYECAVFLARLVQTRQNNTMSKSNGSLALSRIGHTQAELSATLGVNRATVGRWLDGTRTPRDDARAVIERKYAIAPPLWDEPMATPATPRAPTPELPTDHRDVIGGATAQLARLAQQRAETQDPRLLARLEEIERATRHSLSLYLGEGRIISEAVILRSPAWGRVLAKMVATLHNFPEALLAVTQALEAEAD